MFKMPLNICIVKIQGNEKQYMIPQVSVALKLLFLLQTTKIRYN